MRLPAFFLGGNMNTDQAKQLLTKQEDKRNNLLKILQNRDGRKVELDKEDGLSIKIGVSIKIDPTYTVWGTVELNRSEIKDQDETSLVETVHTLLDEQLIVQVLAGIALELKR